MIKLVKLIEEAFVKVDDSFNAELLDRINDEYMEDYTSLTPQQINNGYCDMWAELFVERFGGKHYWSYEVPIGAMGHSWVKLGSKYYDAEVPSGVATVEELPFIQRAISEFGRSWLPKFYDNIQS